MAQPKMNPTALAIFENANITGDYLEGLTLASTDVTTHNGRTIGYEYIGRATGIFGLLVECDGNASDTMAVVAQFAYGTSVWTTKTITLTPVAEQACDTNAFYRLDTNSSWRDVIPFMKMRFTFTKTGTNGSCVVKSRLVIY